MGVLNKLLSIKTVELLLSIFRLLLPLVLYAVLIEASELLNNSVQSLN